MKGFALRFVAALVLVLVTYNPEGWSYTHWVLREGLGSITPEKAVAGVVLTIGWVFMLQSAIRSLGFIGAGLAFALVGTLIWLFVDTTHLGAESAKGITYLALFAIAAVLAVGMSWSLFRRRVTGQVDIGESH